MGVANRFNLCALLILKLIQLIHLQKSLLPFEVK